MTDYQPKTLRLLFPQWQGGGDNPLYPLGARLMSWLAPAGDGPVAEVPVARYDGEPLSVENGITERNALMKQLEAARQLIKAHEPEHLVVFGGDCSISQAPLSYLNERYGGELGVLWIDRHPDVKTPKEAVNLHAMVLGNLLGVGDPEFSRQVGVPLKPENVMFAGLGGVINQEEEVITRMGIRRAGAKELAADSGPVLGWLRESGVKHLAIHLDVDVLHPALLRSVQAGNPNLAPDVPVRSGEMTFESLSRLMTDVSGQAEVVGLAFAEHMPWDAYNLQKMLAGIPILNE
ncbi:arginase [Deltaproteobacteria bacterium Smac51]|nr:arginase [Deltaproteobacteria bacterium Smac51]